VELVGSTSGSGVDLPCVGPVSAARSDLHRPKPRQLVPSSPTGPMACVHLRPVPRPLPRVMISVVPDANSHAVTIHPAIAQHITNLFREAKAAPDIPSSIGRQMCLAALRSSKHSRAHQSQHRCSCFEATVAAAPQTRPFQCLMMYWRGESHSTCDQRQPKV
jgi:hypothetical protein